MCNGKERADRRALFRLLLSERDCTASYITPTAVLGHIQFGSMTIEPN